MKKKPKDQTRPRVRIHGETVTFGEGSPHKGKVRKANPAPKKKAKKKAQRPRVRIHGEGSPYKGKVRKANPLPVLVALQAARKVVARKPNPPALPKPLRKPLVLVLSGEESRQLRGGPVTPAMIRAALDAAKASGRKGWDHIEVQHPGGAHAFDLAP